MEESTSLDEHITGEQLVTIILLQGKIFHDPAVYLHKNKSAQVNVLGPLSVNSYYTLNYEFTQDN
jgi:hypothetical protein